MANIDDIPKRYEPSEFEASIYNMWEKKKKFSPQKGTTGDTYYIPIPPPNVTGVLHLGHALTLAIEDLLIRYHRMKGDEVVWMPGTDHAGIATQSRVAKHLSEQGINWRDLSEQDFLTEIWNWKAHSHTTITNQIKMMGSSVNWEKERFTFDETHQKLVSEAFVKLYNDGTIYRGDYMVNYCPKDRTVISEAEVEYREEEGKMYHIIYFVSGADKELVIATTRPETMLADQAIAVHPKDKRYKKLIGRNVILPVVNKEIPIVGDEMVDMDFGTGVVKITPAHDRNDFEVAKRHDIRTDYRVIDNNGIMMEHTGPFAGMKETEAREEIVDMLRAKGNLLKIEPHIHKVGYSERGKVRVQTIVSTQWFVDSKQLKERVMQGWKKGEFKIVPDRFDKIFEDWMERLHEWCISRQLIWGHKIPAYYDKESGKLLEVTVDPSKLIKKHGKENVVQDSDVLDTWFGVAMWPFSILNWNFENPGELFQKFYPAQVLETGYDILLFWVIRMLLFGYHFTGEAPFKEIYLHGLVVDEKGRKFSKSLGNGIDPIEVINEYSADALRLSLLIGNTPGNNFKFGMDLVKNNQTFLNKLWNVARFVIMNTDGTKADYDTLQKNILKNKKDLLDHEKWILSRFAHTQKSVTEGMEGYHFGSTGEMLFTFTRNEFADYAIEAFKLTKEETKHGKEVQMFILIGLLRLWHPYIPFITEKLHTLITGSTVIDADWPTCDLDRNEEIEEEMKLVFDVIYQIRNIRGDKKIKPGELVDILLYATPNNRNRLEKNLSIITGLGKCKDVQFITTNDGIDEQKYSYGQAGEVDVYIDISAFGNEDEILRLKKLIEEKENYLRTLEIKLTDNQFLSNAPSNVIRLSQDNKNITERQIQKAKEQLAKLES